MTLRRQNRARLCFSTVRPIFVLSFCSWRRSVRFPSPQTAWWKHYCFCADQGQCQNLFRLLDPLQDDIVEDGVFAPKGIMQLLIVYFYCYFIYCSSTNYYLYFNGGTRRRPKCFLYCPNVPNCHRLELLNCSISSFGIFDQRCSDARSSSIGPFWSNVGG